jgi:DNA-binding NarL/FixJ family response regulator
MERPIRVAIVDDREQPRWGLRAFLGTFPDLELVGEARNGSEAIRVAREVKPDVLILDMRLPDRDGLSTWEEIHERDPDVGVVFLTMHRPLADLARARGWPALVKGNAVTKLVGCIRDAARVHVSGG